MKTRIIIVLALCAFLQACGEEFLNVRADIATTIPTSIQDYQALLDQGIMISNSSRLFALAGGEEFTVSSGIWHGLPVVANLRQFKNAYIWADEIYLGDQGMDWNNAYQRILQANLVLDGISNLSPKNEPETNLLNNVKGSALFYRALNFYQLSQLFCKPYDGRSAEQDLGLPLRLEADVTLTSRRATLRQTYDRILTDLLEAERLLPDFPSVKTRPSRVATLALLARVSLVMGDFSKGSDYAKRALALNNVLIDYNSLQLDKPYPFPTGYGQSNEEVLFFSYAPTVPLMANSVLEVNQELLDIYEDDDLRKMLFYGNGSSGNVFFRGSYYGSSLFFVGLSTSEVVLIKTECDIRMGLLDEARELLDVLRGKRYKLGKLTNTPEIDAAGLLRFVLDERRRELAFRGLRWDDLRRLNSDPELSHTISREIDGVNYELKPKDTKYTWPIPDDVIQLSGMEQNKR
ncbi:RagB/SusD family nutrient uptake outer membrane protein [Parapedobacter sp. 10938]|uniref:RagB/SusD family nutrient uptake outer membrane protein n=1 Tax=Parapedobacter flavus TaxID=3110225 RepID=UPI002DB98817|nr:RagB/SusD family nutrient uptake outer membrane protein [Parapedobacter sp. 10938]MEC3881913.1 RagB/SusD family nutrient uptake outer membrane protein [Parapedobacter sp. 10938]